MSFKFRDFWSFSTLIVLFAGSFIAAMAFSHTPAAATLCGTSIATTWSTSTNLGNTGGIDTNEGGFLAECSANPSPGGTSVFAGTYKDTNASSEPGPDPFSYEVFATGGEQLRLELTATDTLANGPHAGFPNFTLDLTNISWFEMEGTITDVELLGDDLFSLSDWTETSIQITFAGIDYNCGDGCTHNFYALINITAEHDYVGDPPEDPIDVPEPASAGLFLVGLAGYGLVISRRRRKKAA